MGRDILVDGYNVLKRGASLQALGVAHLAAARQALITQLASRYRHTPHRVIVVFDGDGVYEQVSHERRVRVIYSRHGETADSVISRLATEARAAGRQVELYSDDSEVQQAVSQQGGGVRTTGQLTNELNAAPRDVARRFRHRQAMQRRYGLNPSNDPDDEEFSPSSQGKGKKGARHKR
jgi:predicted RNA-binding protein with PIN domain